MHLLITNKLCFKFDEILYLKNIFWNWLKHKHGVNCINPFNNRRERCNRPETTKHLLLECVEAWKIWALFNEWIGNQTVNSKVVIEYGDIFWVDDNANTCKAKLKIIQEIIQIERPRAWNMEKIKNISKDKIKYNTKLNN